MKTSFEDRICRLIEKEAESLARGWFKEIIVSAGVTRGKFDVEWVLKADRSLIKKVAFVELFRFQLHDREWDAQDLIAWAQYLEKLAKRLRKEAKHHWGYANVSR